MSNLFNLCPIRQFKIRRIKQTIRKSGYNQKLNGKTNSQSQTKSRSGAASNVLRAGIERHPRRRPLRASLLHDRRARQNYESMGSAQCPQSDVGSKCWWDLSNPTIRFAIADSIHKSEVLGNCRAIRCVQQVGSHP